MKLTGPQVIERLRQLLEAVDTTAREDLDDYFDYVLKASGWTLEDWSFYQSGKVSQARQSARKSSHLKGRKVHEAISDVCRGLFGLFLDRVVRS